MTEKEPKLDVDYAELVSGMRQEFSRRGLLKPVRPEAFLERRLDTQMTLFSERLRVYLTRDWDNLFPGVPRSEENLCRKVAAYLENKKVETLGQFRRELARRTRMRQFWGMIFQRDQLNLIIVAALSFVVLYPFFLKLFFAPNDTDLCYGALGLVITTVINGIFFCKYVFGKRKERQRIELV